MAPERSRYPDSTATSAEFMIVGAGRPSFQELVDLAEAHGYVVDGTRHALNEFGNTVRCRIEGDLTEDRRQPMSRQKVLAILKEIMHSYVSGVTVTKNNKRVSKTAKEIRDLQPRPEGVWKLPKDVDNDTIMRNMEELGYSIVATEEGKNAFAADVRKRLKNEVYISRARVTIDMVRVQVLKALKTRLRGFSVFTYSEEGKVWPEVFHITAKDIEEAAIKAGLQLQNIHFAFVDAVRREIEVAHARCKPTEAMLVDAVKAVTSYREGTIKGESPRPEKISSRMPRLR